MVMSSFKVPSPTWNPGTLETRTNRTNSQGKRQSKKRECSKFLLGTRTSAEFPSGLFCISLDGPHDTWSRSLVLQSFETDVGLFVLMADRQLCVEDDLCPLSIPVLAMQGNRC